MRNSAFVSIVESKSDSSAYPDSCGRGLINHCLKKEKEKMAGRILNTEEYFRHLQKHFHVPKKFSASLYDDLNYWDKLAVW